MSIKRVLLIESGRFIGGVIHSLFREHEQLDVIEARPTSARALLRAVAQHQPDIVVLDDTLKDSFLAQLLNYLQRSEDLRVVVVNTGTNKVEVYEKQHIVVNHTADFFAIL